MKMTEILAIHKLVSQRIDVISPSREDQLRDIIWELGSVQTNEDELRMVSNAEITLYLNPRFQKVAGMLSLPPSLTPSVVKSSFSTNFFLSVIFCRPG